MVSWPTDFDLNPAVSISGEGALADCSYVCRPVCVVVVLVELQAARWISPPCAYSSLCLLVSYNPSCHLTKSVCFLQAGTDNFFRQHHYHSIHTHCAVIERCATALISPAVF